MSSSSTSNARKKHAKRKLGQAPKNENTNVVGAQTESERPKN